MEWNGKKIEDQVYWFESQSDPNLNSNAYEIAYSLVQKHFPGEFGSEILVKKVVDKILQETAVKRSEDEGRVRTQFFLTLIMDGSLEFGS